MPSIPVLGRATMRDHDVHERAATPLELLFDLCFVVAVAFLAAELHHGLAAGHAVDAAARYAALFIPIWWAWMSYTWFATAFSHDDPLTRLLTLAQMGGVLAVAAAVPRAFQGELVPFAVAYLVMRLPLVLQWLRSARDDAQNRAFALTYATGSVVAQGLWLIGAVLGGVAQWGVFVVALAVELTTPVLAVRRAPGRVFHPGHIAERYGLFTIIVLGETILAVAIGLRDTLGGGAGPGALVLVVAALVVAFGLWWIYFDALGRDGLTRNRRAAFTWGYGHYLLFAAVAAIGAGVQAQLEVLAGAGEQDQARAAAPAAGGVLAAADTAVPAGAVAWVAVPVAIALAAVAWLQLAANRRAAGVTWLVAGALACLAVVAPAALLPVVTALPVTGLLLAAVVAALVPMISIRASFSPTQGGKPAP